MDKPRQGKPHETISDAAGYYSMLNVLEGTYDLSVKMTGFKNYLERRITVAINTVRRMDVCLQVGQDTVTVEASAAVLQTSKADVSANLESLTARPRCRSAGCPLGLYNSYP